MPKRKRTQSKTNVKRAPGRRRRRYSLEHEEERGGADDQGDGEVEDAHFARHHNSAVAEELVAAGELLPFAGHAACRGEGRVLFVTSAAGRGRPHGGRGSVVAAAAAAVTTRPAAAAGRPAETGHVSYPAPEQPARRPVAAHEGGGEGRRTLRSGPGPREMTGCGRGERGRQPADWIRV